MMPSEGTRAVRSTLKLETIERQGMEDALKEAEELNRAILASLKDHIAVLDGDGRIIAVNDAWNDLKYENGVTLLDAMDIGINYMEAMLWASTESNKISRAVLDGIQSVLSRKCEHFMFEYPCHSSSGLRWLLVTVTPLKRPGGGAVITHTDATEKRRIQEELREALATTEQMKDRLEAEDIPLDGEFDINCNFGEIVGQSAALKNALYLVECVAPTDATVLILGETGTGKELFAHAIHRLSARRDLPFVKVDCGSIPGGLLESELFGHEKGAFTGAVKQHLGRFELANGGTIFLDEIGNLPLELQAKLLCVLQDSVIERLGGNGIIKLNVRVIAASNGDLEQRNKTGGFREDLYHRLATFPLRLPPVRERSGDIPLLVHHFVKKHSDKLGKKIEVVPQELIESLESYHLPGNVRELENIIARAVILSTGSTLQVDGLLNLPHRTEPRSDGLQALAEVERAHILRALADARWRIEGPHGAASILRLNPGTLRSRMKKHGITRPM